MERKNQIPLSAEEREQVKEKFGTDFQCSFFKNSDGKYYCTTHRARSKYHDSIDDITKKEVDFVSSTS